jgi:hypothetical protein
LAPFELKASSPVNLPQFSILPGENRIVIPWLPKVSNILSVSHVHTSCHAGCVGPGWNLLPSALQCVFKRHNHFLPAQYAEDTALVASSCSPSLVFSYLKACRGRLELWPRDWRTVINVWNSAAVLFVKAARRIQNPEPFAFARRTNILVWNTSLFCSEPDKFRTIWRFIFSPTTSDYWMGISACNWLMRWTP